VTLTRIARYLALTGYFGLLALLLLWNAWLAPSRHFPVAMVLIVMLVPLLLPLRGLLHGRPYTHAWTSFLSLLYFTHGVVEAYSNPAERHYAVLETLFSVALFLGAIFYVKFRAAESRQARIS
jgi:uncharacterized membrane protein